MGLIRELPPSVINQIAAGEVVERPASVVKELLENAIDAGASRVELTVERGGKDLVRVADDGSGMHRDDLLPAFRPHATSKLETADDLFRIATLGFRGEALAAIAEVSRVRCQTRRRDDPVGSELNIEAGVPAEVKDCGCAPGTVIEVRNLFFNTPVRRTFLKSDSTEAGHVTETFTRVALAHPTVHFTMRSGGKVAYDLPPVTGVKERVAVFFGRELAESLLWVESQVDQVHLWGYVGHPSQSRSSAKGQYLFVAGRYVRDRSLSHALSEAYRGLLMVGRSPLAFLHLELPPDEVDVNVHPTKIEVRFRDSQRIYSQMLSMIRSTFLASDLHSRLQVPPPEEGPSSSWSSRSDSPKPSESFSLRAPSPDRQSISSWFGPPSTPTSSPSQPFTLPGQRPPADWADRLPPPVPPGSGDLFDEFAPSISPNDPPPRSESTALRAPESSPPPPPARLDLPPRAIQVHDTYLIAETPGGMVVIDQHALHERILFEELKSRLSHHGIESQLLLVPEPVDLPPGDASSLLDHRDLLSKLGLGLDDFGGNTVLVTSLPPLLGSLSPTTLIRDLADHLRTKPLPPTSDELLNDVMSMMACKAAIKANQRLTDPEISSLLERRHLVSDTHHCPHGRPTALVFTREELEKQFGRLG